MARVRIRESNIQAKLTKWAQGQETLDELIYLYSEVDFKSWQQKAWDLANMIIKSEPDTVDGFNKITFVEKL